MKILVYGAGVLGSLYAIKLYQSGYDVTLLARGKRYEEIYDHGVILVGSLSGERTVSRVPVVRTLEPDEMYDLIIVLVRADQVSELLPVLAANRNSISILFMVNNPNGYAEWIKAVGIGRLLLGFAGAGGTRKDGVVTYHVVSPILQPTTLAEPDGTKSERIKQISKLFENAGFPTAICSNMEGWQKTHVAWISAVANAILAAGGDGRALSQMPDLLRLLVDAINEGFAVLHKLNIPITPNKLKIISVMPKALTRFLFKLWSKTKHFDTIATRHTLAAYSEMKLLSEDFQAIARSASIPTPALDRLHQYMLDCSM
ncbi:MAG: ketopantoate reductase family protein [Chloroflexi bacterium HGW-Chloroflexi-5]|jgi:2-dehydropantoate 2-reductase|nr:MAG: ketopantoate reductase family protein [Chloroflexi bacterium HGW-Chloroflexi-5]